MSIPFIPLFIIFIIAFAMMLVGLCLSSRTLATAQREEKGPFSSKYVLVTGRGRGPYGGLLLILLCGLVFGLSVLFLYKVANTILPKPYFVLPYQIETNVTPNAASLHIPRGVSDASKVLKRLAQLDHNQYDSDQQYDIWAASACSATAMTEVINAYGHNYRIADILQAEINQSAISPERGLLKLAGIDHTVAQFGFGTAQLSRAPLDSIISVANNGWPIIVDFPPSGDWPTGHFLVVVGGDSNSVFLADSSPHDFAAIPQQQFLRDWSGFAVVVMPKGQ